ncbi:hypothetical protein M569_16218 [Genlisea aurea]|uniref:Uncharacterized protein n=1 Tax=Genlisea aurea TaxID=192259 RepID=S8BVG9_9LAMI|nr:hypothetical protein M569_16218 [Genlisea aurea]
MPENLSGYSDYIGRRSHRCQGSKWIPPQYIAIVINDINVLLREFDIFQLSHARREFNTESHLLTNCMSRPGAAAMSEGHGPQGGDRSPID